MSAIFHSSARKDSGAAGQALYDAANIPAMLPGPTDQACCCVARAVVRVVMPPTRGRPHETELLLCGHHYRTSRQALAEAKARVRELPGIPSDTAALVSR
jgi:hypothetical protein